MSFSSKFGLLILTIFATLFTLFSLFSWSSTPITFAAEEDLNSYKVDKYLTIGTGTNIQKHSYFTNAETEQTSPLGSFILDIISYLIQIIGVICIGTIIVGGFLLITAQGNESQLEKGKDVIKYSIIGLVVAFSSYIISIFVQGLFYD